MPVPMPQPDYAWRDKAYWGRVCQACDHEIKCNPPKDYDKGASYITPAYANKTCPKCKSEAFDYGSYRHAKDCDCFYCTEDEDIIQAERG